MKWIGLMLAPIFAILAAGTFMHASQQKRELADAAAEQAKLTERNAKLEADRKTYLTRLTEAENQLKRRQLDAEIQPAPTGSPGAVELARLRAELEAARKQLAAREPRTSGDDEPPAATASAKPDAPASASRSPEDWQARRRQEMEDLKKNDPETYQERVERRNQIRTEMKQGIDERLEFFSGMDLAGLPPEVAASHNELLRRMQSMAEAFDQLVADPDAELDFGLMRENMGAMNDIMKQEREILMQDLANDLGYKGDDAQELLSTIDYIREMTSPPRPSFGRGGPPGRR